MELEATSPLVGKSVEEAGLRHLAGVYLAEIQRSGKVLPAVPPTEVLAAGDRLVFVGAVESIMDLQRMPGLRPATDQLFKLDTPRHERQVLEVVLTRSFPLLGQTVRQGKFRTTYNAVVVAVSRGGQRVHGKVGDIRLEAGDTLLLEAPPGFWERHRASKDFYIVSPVSNSHFFQHGKAWLSLGTLLALVAAVSLGFCSLLEGAVAAAGLVVATGCLSWRSLWQAVDWPLLLTLGAALGVGESLQVTGAAAKLAEGLLALAGTQPQWALVAVFCLTALLTQFITNNAAAALAFPVATALAQQTGSQLMPYALAVMVAASSAFLTPWGYQTNLLVQGPGNYRTSDYLRLGLPLFLWVALFSCWWIPQLWPF
jgi:di/tricarboxylate transporter